MSEKTKQQESSNSQNSTGTNNNLNSDLQIVDRGNIEKIEDTVFSIANNDKGWFLAIGPNIITQPKPTRKECLEQLEKDMWNIIMKMIIVVTDQTLEVALEEKGLVKNQ